MQYERSKDEYAIESSEIEYGLTNRRNTADREMNAGMSNLVQNIATHGIKSATAERTVVRRDLSKKPSAEKSVEKQKASKTTKPLTPHARRMARKLSQQKEMQTVIISETALRSDQVPTPPHMEFQAAANIAPEPITRKRTRKQTRNPTDTQLLDAIVPEMVPEQASTKRFHGANMAAAATNLTPPVITPNAATMTNPNVELPGQPTIPMAPVRRSSRLETSKEKNRFNEKIDLPKEDEEKDKK